MSTLPVVLLGGDAIAVSAARSLAGIGARVHSLGLGSDPIRYSRSCAEFVDIGNHSGVAERYLDWLESGPRGAVVLPCDDHSLEFIARHRPALHDLGYLPIEADDEVVLAMLDKGRTAELAERAGVPVPRTVRVQSAPEAVAAAAAIGYPCALKPVTGHSATLHGLHDKLIVVRNEGELSGALARTLDAGIDVLVTELVVGGPGNSCSCYSYLTPEGEPLFSLTKRSLRQFPTQVGLVTYHETVWEPQVAELGLRFFAAVGLRGVGNVEFKRDARDGAWRLIECNHRFTAANELVRRAGIDIPLIAYSRLSGRPLPPLGDYRTGMRMWHPIEDVRGLASYRREGKMTVGAWARSLAHRQHFPLFRWDDIGPSAASMARKLRALPRRARRRTAGAA